ncbi:endonuclease/exonuclease/phosphatase family protein [Rhodococcus erythropolis]|uniref:endonuclease/exonuclease/phosphatase family protein n=1 Tax=Rhodococcus erythropolis TaxID=1833 RepID=UPI000878C622|nr:endonuclease/exonuclease/phosphatase family protein [Rhodococcus erythropolis]OFV73552.1 endonuclease/exonuclease/phosphatase family protein [Rhodococcus erythropolis]
MEIPAPDQAGSASTEAGRGSVRRKVLLFGGIVCAAASAMGFVLHHIGPQSNLLIILTSFTPISICIGIIGLVSLAGAHAWRTLVIGIVVVGVAASTQMPLYLRTYPDLSRLDAGSEIRLLQANIRLGEADLPDLAQQLRDRRIDVLTVEELTDDAVAGLERAGITGLLPHQYLMPKPSGGGGTGIYSRFPLSDQQPLGFFAMANLSAKLEVGQGHTVTIAAVHPMAPYPSPAWMWAWEMDRLRTAVHQRSEDGDPVIVSGDFNSTYSHSRYRAMLTDGFQDAADQVGAGDIRTYPADRAFPAILGIDHVVTKQILVHKLERITLPGSDHYGLFAVLAPHF